MKIIASFLVLICTIVIGQPLAAAENPSGEPSYVTEKISVTGAVENKLTLQVGDLKKFPPHQIGQLPLICQSGQDKGKLKQIKGVLLRDILEKAIVVAPEHNDVKKMVVIASASDGYKVVFSWSEIFNSSLGDGIIVFYEEDGKPLGEDEGHIAMVSTKDTKTGPRHVKWLENIEVKKIVE